jgi:hypothetical protein
MPPKRMILPLFELDTLWFESELVAVPFVAVSR